MLRFRPLVAALVVALLAVSPASATAGWSAPSKVWPGDYTQPSMVVDAQGYEHIAARDDTGIWYLTNKTGSGDWTRVRLTRDVTDAHGHHIYDDGPSIVFDRSEDSLTVVYTHVLLACCPTNSDVRYITFPAQPHGLDAYSRPRRIPGIQVTGSVAVRRGVIAVAATFAVPDIQTVTFVTNASGHWTSTDLGPQRIGGPRDPSLALDSHGHPVIAFTTVTTSGHVIVKVARGATRTGGFTVEHVASGSEPSLALDAHDQPRLAFRGTDCTDYARRDATGWHVTRVMAADQSVELRLDRDGRPHIIAGADSGDRAGLWYATKTAGSWHHTRLDTHVPIALSLSIALGGMWSGGPVHVVYQVHHRVWRTQSD